MGYQRQPRRRRSFLIGILSAICAVFGAMQSASAHPLGNFTINRYARLEPAHGEVRVVYIVDMAEIPTHVERAAMDIDGDSQLTETEVQSYRLGLANDIQQKLTLTADGQMLALHLVKSALAFPPGQADLPTLRLEATYAGQLPQASAELVFHDGNYPDRIGWQEIVVRPALSLRLLTADAPTEDRSQGLTVYPADLLNQPPQVREIAIRVAPSAVGPGEAAVLPRSAPVAVAQLSGSLGRADDGFARLVTTPELSLWTVLLSMLAALGWGAVHSFSPGHGKTIVAAYLVGARGTVRHALFLGLTTTITHTAGVFLLGFVALALSRFILPEQLYPWLSALSGALVVVIGVALIRDRLRGVHHHHGHGFHFGHEHEHGHAYEHAHDHDHGHHRDHGHGNELAQASHIGPPVLTDDAHLRSHLPPGADGQPVTWRRLLALGISGGLLPCPSALVLMLAAISLDRIGFGLMLIVFFSIGLAGVLTGIGIVLVHANKVFDRIPLGGRVLRLVPIGSALFITLAGLVITAHALAQTGL